MYRLLIADDEALIRRGIQKLIDLKSLGIEEIYEASTGEEALQIFEEVHPEIVLLDINMPKVDGLTVAKKMRFLSPEVKIVIITGYHYFDYAHTAIKVGVEDYILKPVSKQDVSEILSRLVYSLKQEKKERKAEKVLEELSVFPSTEGILKNGYREQIQTILEECYTDSEFTLGVLAEKMDLSPGYLSSIFKKSFGIPFQDFLLQKRMEKAKLLLLTTELKNYEIAEQVGFQDVNYFGLKFKKYSNQSPKQYKEMVAKYENHETPEY